VGTDGNQALPFNAYQQDDQLYLDTPADSSYYPLRLFAGKGLVAAGTDAFYDFGDTWLPIRAQRRPRYATTGTLLTPIDSSGTGGVRGAWDGREPGCVWHRLTIDACVPAGTSLQVWSRAADDQRDLSAAAWQQEPAPYRRGDGSEQPYVRLAAASYGTWELLFQRARGRYLQLKIVLVGNCRSTPRVRAVRAYYPRFSYLERYLPAAYRADPPSASFLDRFLANVEGTFTALEDKIAAVQVLFDPCSAPSDALDWLAGWFGVALDPAWDDGRRRLFLRHALDFFRFRGTVCGLEMALRLAFDACPDDSIFTDCLSGAGPAYSVRIVEKFRTRGTSGALTGADTNGGLRSVTPGARWTIAEKRAGLNRRYREFPRPASAPPPSAEYPLQAPADDAATWQRFSQTVLGFVPSAGPGDLPRWQAFLARRYRTAAALQSAYPGAGRPADVPLPERLPPDGSPLADWYQFESIVLATARRAHRFTVLLPAPPDDTPDRAAQTRLMEWAKRVVNLEKPAHTAFDVRFYWAMFRVGQARLGLDSLLDQASRDLQSRRPIVLDRSYLAEGFLTPQPPGEAGRYLLGRVPLGIGSREGDRA
jgi:phage tail-like protein